MRGFESLARVSTVMVMGFVGSSGTARGHLPDAGCVRGERGAVALDLALYLADSARYHET